MKAFEMIAFGIFGLLLGMTVRGLTGYTPGTWQFYAIVLPVVITVVLLSHL